MYVARQAMRHTHGSVAVYTCVPANPDQPGKAAHACMPSIMTLLTVLLCLQIEQLVSTDVHPILIYALGLNES